MMMFSRTLRFCGRRSIALRRNLGLVYSAHGPPEEVLSLQTTGADEKRDSPGPHEVSLRLLAAPINPSDIKTVDGTFKTKPPPSVAGLEGVFEVMKVGNQCTQFQPGDKVLTLLPAWGTWQSNPLSPEDDLILVPPDVPDIAAATVLVNPGAAYRLLKDFVELREGDVVIQNSANSGFGQAVIQIASAWKLRTINIVRDRPNLSHLVDHLKSRGATEVVTEEFAQSHQINSLIEQLGKPKLALDGVGGKSSVNLLRSLADGGTLLAYAAMSQEPVTAPAGLLIFNDKRIRGFSFIRWLGQSPIAAAKDLCNALFGLVQTNHLKTVPHTMWKLEDFREAVTESKKPFGGKKHVFVADS